MNTRSTLALLFLASLLPACSGTTNAIVETVRSTVLRGSDLQNFRLNPDFKYLRVTVDGRTALLVLGYVEDHPDGPIQVWYSAQREVIRLQNGRLVGATGLTSEWRNVVLGSAPSWFDIAKGEAPHPFVRSRDSMPGYRYGIKESLLVKPAPAPRRSELQGVDPGSLKWFEESVASSSPPSNSGKEVDLPVARYAVAFDGSSASVVYGEQCLSRDVCFSWQRWPAVPPPAKTGR